MVEIYNKEEFELVLKYDCEIIGINNRNLKIFVVFLEIIKKFIDLILNDKIFIVESGIMSIVDFEKMKEFGVDGVLVGELFMRNIDNKEFKELYKKFRN